MQANLKLLNYFNRGVIMVGIVNGRLYPVVFDSHRGHNHKAGFILVDISGSISHDSTVDSDYRTVRGSFFGIDGSRYSDVLARIYDPEKEISVNKFKLHSFLEDLRGRIVAEYRGADGIDCHSTSFRNACIVIEHITLTRFELSDRYKALFDIIVQIKNNVDDRNSIDTNLISQIREWGR